MEKVHRHKRGAPDKYLDQVEPESGKVYSHRVGPDRYVAEVKSNGRIYRHKPSAPDDYLGKVKDMLSLAEGGAAYFLLLLPAIEEEVIEEKGAEAQTQAQGW